MDIIKKTQGYANIYQTSNFQKEFEALFNKDSTVKKRYLQWLYSKLIILDKMGVRSTDGHHFELLKGYDKTLYSICGRSKNNPRVIYSFLDEEKTVILLTSILEKSKSDYDLGCNRAISRLQEIKEELRL